MQQQSLEFSLRHTGPVGFLSTGAGVSAAWHAGTLLSAETDSGSCCTWQSAKQRETVGNISSTAHATVLAIVNERCL